MAATPPNPQRVRSLLGTENLSKAEILSFLDGAEAFRAQTRTEPTLAGKTVVLVFFEASTRTRLSFELAAKRLGANTLILNRDTSSVGKGETLLDTAKTIEAMHPDLLVLRHSCAGSPYILSQAMQIPVINAGDGFHEHPTQALLDLLTIRQFKKKLEGLRVLIVGDIAHSRVARSDIYALRTLGAKIRVCGPPTLMPPRVDRLGVEVSYDLSEAVKDQDVIILLRIQAERLENGQTPSLSEYAKFYALNRSVLAKGKSDVLVMHPGPVNRGVELTTEVADGPSSVILDQVSNGVFVRMAILHQLMGNQIHGGPKP